MSGGMHVPKLLKVTLLMHSKRQVLVQKCTIWDTTLDSILKLWRKKSFHAALCSPVKEVSAPLTASTGVKRTRSSLVFAANVLIIWWLESRITLIKAEVLAICWSGAFRYVLAVCFGRCHICFDTHTSDRTKVIKHSKSHDSDSTETC